MISMVKKLFFFLGIIFLAVFLFHYFFPDEKTVKYDFISAQKNISFCDGGYCWETVSKEETVRGFLTEKKINFGDKDLIFPGKDEKIYSGSKITILRAKKISVKEGGKTTEFYTVQNTVEQAIWENKNINLGDDDIAKPARESFIKDEMLISVTHVEIKEEIKQEDIAYKTISNEDDKLSWRTKKVTQKGEKGIQEVKYKVVYYDGKEISRKILEKNRIKEPLEEIVTQGTYVKTGKTHTGLGTWYAFKGGLFAASPWLPMGSYAKVTNKENGKSVIVQINDRGPFGENRIIDLDKVAFAKIASLGAGVIDVKVEEVLN